MAEPAHRSGPSRQGLVEYLVLVGALAILAAGAVALFGPELRAVLGAGPGPSAPAQPSPPPSAAR